MSKCYLLFAEGFEECEGLVTLDILRRAGLEAYTVSIQDAHTVVGAHGVPITCDRTLPELLAAFPNKYQIKRYEGKGGATIIAYKCL